MADSEWTMELEQVSEASMGHSRTCRGPLRHEAEIYYKAFVDGELVYGIGIAERKVVKVTDL